MKNKLYDAFMQMTADADPGRVQAAVQAEIGSESRKPRQTPARRFYRTAAVLAAVLVLSVTVCAAAVKHLTVTVPEDGKYDYLVKVTDGEGVARVDKDALQELASLGITQEDIQAGNRVSKTFDTWTEAAKWLDCGLLVSDRMTEDATEWGKVTLTAHVHEDGKLSTLTLTGAAVETETGEACTVCVSIPLESWGEKYDLVVGYGEDTHSGRTTETMEYVTPSGIRAEIVDVVSLSLDENGSTIRVYDTTFHIFHEGIRYMISMGGRHTESQADLAKAIADSMGYVK
ncbi:MAG: hypothetical protein E7631_08425 [Ruminococcaceae bacterium]|nr:hypothetical protein [Oscillospiraceae bacterium]